MRIPRKLVRPSDEHGRRFVESRFLECGFDNWAVCAFRETYTFSRVSRHENLHLFKGFAIVTFTRFRADRSAAARRKRNRAPAFACRRSTIAGPSAKPVPNGRFAEGLCFARVLRGFRDLRRSGASSENAGDASSLGRKRPLALLFLRSFRTCVRNGESPFSRCRSEGRPPVTDLVLPENDDGADTLPSKKDDANAVQSSSSGLYSPNASCSVAEPSSPAA